MNDINGLLELKRYLLKTKEKLLNGFRNQESDNRLFVINVTLDNIEKRIEAAKMEVTYH